ncbi:MAG: polyprenyl diphosphate synthase [Bacilli bacterium]|nr:polyprenyl diphosphate synthase [Bacilli bacterium]MDD3305044.1 polyprenyl diphosphate synthase [Bacilli bacterium]MDD4053469.1 polyprenyl diphosphate synthase [Bacilli bacterium]MDD4411761.1 polyprenyl diphosphate synthase [Bacilli bacterium]
MSNYVIPNHVGIILDGNRRWATERGLAKSEGHLEGAKNLITMVEYIFKKGVNVLSVFAFSTENFKRSKEEVDYLMKLFIKMFNSQLKRLEESDVKVIFSGIKNNLSNDVIKAMKVLEENTKNNKYIFNICLNYGGQSEIVDALKRIVNDNIDINTITTDEFKKYLYNYLPDIDLIIRTSGEQRISNFMIYQLAYAELYFTKTYWPAFTGDDFDKAIDAYNGRDRRFGGN